MGHKQTVVHPYYGIPLNNEYEQTIDTHNNLDKGIKLKEPSLKRLHMVHFYCMTPSKRQNSDQKNRLVVARVYMWGISTKEHFGELFMKLFCILLTVVVTHVLKVLSTPKMKANFTLLISKVQF